ncbi:MAG: hypothetical protein HUU09_13375 [Candidatus Jettenia caeni]|nr:hypothetical protein [Candidatus Jettenia caeni]
MKICAKFADVRHVINVASLLRMAFAVDVAKNLVIVPVKGKNNSGEKKIGHYR